MRGAAHLRVYVFALAFSITIPRYNESLARNMDAQKHRWAPLADRSNSFDQAILSADRRAWHPLQVDLFSLSIPFDVDATPMLPPRMVIAFETESVAAALDSDAKRTRFINETVRIHLSDILWGERAALAHAARLCLSNHDLGALEAAAVQTREEARHVAAFSLLIARRWGTPLAPTPVFAEFLQEVAASGNIGKEIAGMQVLVEGLAMGIFAALEGELLDPLCREVIRLVMADEASHLKTGATWMAKVLESISAQERADIQQWTAQQFVRLSRGLFAPTQRPEHYARFDLDPRRVGRELRRQGKGRLQPSAAATIFCTAAKAVARAGLMGPATVGAYAGFI
jgi:hypothetical protein